LSWLPSKLAGVLALVDDIGRTTGMCALFARAVVGTGLLIVPGALPAQAAAVERLRREADTVGHVVVLGGDPRLKAAVDVWGPIGEAALPLAALKRSFDPAGILNAARGPL
jgi:hypothetical protein